MSQQTTAETSSAIDYVPAADATPITLHADTLPATAPTDLRDFKQTLTDDNLVPTRLIVDASFDTDCSFTIQDEIDRLRTFIRVATFLGASTLTVTIDDVAAPDKVRPALSAVAERAERDGLHIDLDGPLTLDR